MKRDILQDTKNKSKLINVMQDRYKLSALVFVAVIVVGLVWAGIGQLKNLGTEKSATSDFGIESVEVPDWWLSDNFGASVCEKDDCKPESDPDGDKLTNQQEYFYNTNPNNKDTNENGLTDGEDVAFGYAPNKPGRLTFEQASSDDNIVGESLLFDSDVKDILLDMTDLSKVVLPEINDAELNIIDDSSQELFVEYMLALDTVSKKYYTNPEEYKDLGEQIKQNNPTVINNLKAMSVTAREDYRKIPVPRDLVQLHKYHISLWAILPKVLDVPQTSFDATNDAQMSAWYDSTQIMIALNQKLEIELQKVRNTYLK